MQNNEKSKKDPEFDQSNLKVCGKECNYRTYIKSRGDYSCENPWGERAVRLRAHDVRFTQGLSGAERREIYSYKRSVSCLETHGAKGSRGKPNYSELLGSYECGECKFLKDNWKTECQKYSRKALRRKIRTSQTDHSILFRPLAACMKDQEWRKEK